ncbi:hypothetical protein POSPLADRAFT_1153458, partial [Postia placenta MAD-698-R-SB12]
LHRRLENVSSSKPIHIQGGCVISSQCESRQFSLVDSRRQYLSPCAWPSRLYCSRAIRVLSTWAVWSARPSKRAAMQSLSLSGEEAMA